MLLALLLLAAAPQKTLAVLEFHSKLPKNDIDAAYVSDFVRTAAKDVDRSLKVMTRENMLVLLEASGKKMEECEGECEVDTGRRVGADLVVSGEILKFGTQLKVTMKLHDTHSGELINGSQAQGKDADELDKALGPAVTKLLAPLNAEPAQPQQQVQQQVVTRPEPASEPQARPLPFTFGVVGTVGLYENNSGSTSETSYTYGLGIFAGYRLNDSVALAAFGDLDNFTRDVAGASDFTGYTAGGQLRWGSDDAVFVGAGYSTAGSGGGMIEGGFDWRFSGPFAFRMDLSYRAGDILMVRGGLGVVF